MAGRKKTKSWLQLSPDWKTPRTFPGLENAEDFPRTKGAEDFPRTKSAEDFTRAKLFLDFFENHFEMSINQLELSLYLQGRKVYELSYQTQPFSNKK
jgi:hypothetical protein